MYYKIMNSKNKGSSYERKISKILSLYLTDNKSEIAIWRTDTSGGRATLRSKNKKEFSKENSGDIKKVVERNIYKKVDLFFDTFTVELKHYKEIDYHPELKGSLKSFFDQVYSQKKTTNKFIFLIIKENRKKELLFTDLVLIGLKLLCTYYYDNLILHCYCFDDFLKNDLINMIPKTIKFKPNKKNKKFNNI